MEVVHIKGMLPLDLHYLQELASSAAVSLSPAKGCKVLEHCPVQKTEIVKKVCAESPCCTVTEREPDAQAEEKAAWAEVGSWSWFLEIHLEPGGRGRRVHGVQ